MLLVEDIVDTGNTQEKLEAAILKAGVRARASLCSSTHRPPRGRWLLNPGKRPCQTYSGGPTAPLPSLSCSSLRHAMSRAGCFRQTLRATQQEGPATEERAAALRGFRRALLAPPDANGHSYLRQTPWRISFHANPGFCDPACPLLLGPDGGITLPTNNSAASRVGPFESLSAAPSSVPGCFRRRVWDGLRRARTANRSEKKDSSPKSRLLLSHAPFLTGQDRSGCLGPLTACALLASLSSPCVHHRGFSARSLSLGSSRRRRPPRRIEHGLDTGPPISGGGRAASLLWGGDGGLRVASRLRCFFSRSAFGSSSLPVRVLYLGPQIFFCSGRRPSFAVGRVDAEDRHGVHSILGEKALRTSPTGRWRTGTEEERRSKHKRRVGHR